MRSAEKGRPDFQVVDLELRDLNTKDRELPAQKPKVDRKCSLGDGSLYDIYAESCWST